MKKFTSRKLAVVFIEVVVIIVMFIVMFRQTKSNNITEIDLKKLTVPYDEMQYDGTCWSIDKDSATGLVGKDDLIYGPGISLKRGTYTLVLDYTSTEIHRGVLEVKGGVLDAADYFVIGNNKHEIRYDFSLRSDVEDFRFRLKYFNGGYFSLNGLTLIRNNHNIRCAIFTWLLLSIVLNCFMFSENVRKNKNTIAIIFGIALLASLPLFPKGMMTGDDMRYHLLRIEAIMSGLKSGQFPVRMYPVFNDDYGYPVPMLYGDMLMYFPALLRIIGFSVVQSYKGYIFFINLITACTSYYCGKKIFDKTITASTFSLAFTMATYRLLCLYSRAAAGAFNSTCFYPLVILAIWNIYTKDIKHKDYKKNAIILAIGVAGLIYHNILATELVVSTLLVLALALYKLTFRKETLLVIGKSIVLCALISAAFAVPFLEYYSSVDLLLKESSSRSAGYIQDSGAYLSDYFAFFKSITGGNYLTRQGLRTPGLVLMAGLALGIYLILTKKADSRIRVTTIASIILLFISSNLCPWNRIYDIPILGPILVTVQFQYRYLGVAICFMSVLLCLCIERVIELGVNGRKVYTYAICFSLLMSFYFLSEYQDERFVTSVYNPQDTADLYVYTRDGNYGMGEYVSGLLLMKDTNVLQEALDYGVYGDNIKAIILGEDGVKLAVYVQAGENATLEVPRFAYPYMFAKDSAGNYLEVIKGHNNKVVVQFPESYSGEVYIDFEEPWHWRAAEIVSLITVLLLIGQVLYSKRKLGKS